MRSSILGIIVSAAVGSFAFFGVASPAYAALAVVITGKGVWGDGTPVVQGFSEPGASFSFTLVLPNPIPSNPADGDDFKYSLTPKGGGAEEFLSPHVPVEFFTADFAGLFDLFPKKSNGPEDVVISFYGPQVSFSGLIIPGEYNGVAAGMQSQPASGTADISIRPLTVTGFGGGVVPEPSTWVMMALGFAGLAFAGYRSSLSKGLPPRLPCV